jgi:hypothetical protein
MGIEKMYVIYFMHIGFIQFFLCNHWLNFDQMSFEFQNDVTHILKFFFFMFRIPKRWHQDFDLLHTYHTCYTCITFWVKSDEKWFTCNVLSHISFQFFLQFVQPFFIFKYLLDGYIGSTILMVIVIW